MAVYLLEVHFTIYFISLEYHYVLCMKSSIAWMNSRKLIQQPGSNVVVPGLLSLRVFIQKSSGDFLVL